MTVMPSRSSETLGDGLPFIARSFSAGSSLISTVTVRSSPLRKIFSVAGSAMNAQSQRLNTVASNLANADSATSANGQPYKAKQVVFAATPVGENGATGVNVAAVVEDQSPMKMVYDPKNPLADEKGYVTMPNVQLPLEMMNLNIASRAYQANAAVLKRYQNMVETTLELLR